MRVTRSVRATFMMQSTMSPDVHSSPARKRSAERETRVASEARASHAFCRPPLFPRTEHGVPVAVQSLDVLLEGAQAGGQGARARQVHHEVASGTTIRPSRFVVVGVRPLHLQADGGLATAPPSEEDVGRVWAGERSTCEGSCNGASHCRRLEALRVGCGAGDVTRAARRRRNHHAHPSQLKHAPFYPMMPTPWRRTLTGRPKALEVRVHIQRHGVKIRLLGGAVHERVSRQPKLTQQIGVPGS